MLKVSHCRMLQYSPPFSVTNSIAPPLRNQLPHQRKHSCGVYYTYLGTIVFFESSGKTFTTSLDFETTCGVAITSIPRQLIRAHPPDQPTSKNSQFHLQTRHHLLSHRWHHSSHPHCILKSPQYLLSQPRNPDTYPNTLSVHRCPHRPVYLNHLHRPQS